MKNLTIMKVNLERNTKIIALKVFISYPSLFIFSCSLSSGGAYNTKAFGILGSYNALFTCVLLIPKFLVEFDPS